MVNRGQTYPEVGPAARGADIPPVSYLNWYVPVLTEQRQHNLSFSGLQFPWDLSDVKDVWKDHRGPGYDHRDLVANMYGIPREMVQLCLGATQGISLAILGASRGGKVAVEMPSYGPVSQTARLLGLETMPVSRKGGDGPWNIQREEWKQVLQQCDTLVISPQLNPIGWSYTDDDREWLVHTCKELDVMIVSDEVYAGADKNWRPFFTEGDNCITISSLTKVHGLGVLRYGWVIAAPHVVKWMENAFRNLEGEVASPTIRLVEHIKDRLHEPVELIEKYRTHNLPVLQAMLERVGIEWTPPPHGVFGAFRVPGVDTMEMIDTIGREHGVLAVPGCMFNEGMKEWLRVAWSIDPESFSEAIDALESVLRVAMNIP